MSHLSAEHLEYFVNDILKEELQQLEHYIDKYNEEIMEFVQLKNTVQTLRDNLPGGFKTQMNIGGNLFMQANVDSAERLLVDVGKGCYLELELDEALKFCDFKTRLLTKECDVLRAESIKKRADIKLALMCIAEQQQLHARQQD